MTLSSDSSSISADPPAKLPWTAVALSAVVCLILVFGPSIEGMPPAAQRLLGVTALMATLWVTQVIPLAATSLIPLAAFPLLYIQDVETVSVAFVNENVFLYIGGFVIALAIERWNLHRRIALNVMRIVGVRPRRLVLGFLIATGGLSMWISNTASALLMLPIAMALLKTLDDDLTDVDDGPSLSSRLAVPMLLAIAYSSSIGGLTTIIGTPTNNMAVGIYEREFPQMPEISVAGWMFACIPIGIVYLAVTWWVLTHSLPAKTKHDSEMHGVLQQRTAALGKISRAEWSVLIVFLTTALLWVFRRELILGNTKIFPGWSELLPGFFSTLDGDMVDAKSAKGYVGDATVAITMALLLFLIPSGTRDTAGRSVPLMDWRTAVRLPWDIVLLFGGGFALAGAFKSTQLSEWLGSVLQGPAEHLPVWLLIAMICLLMTFLTEFTSNVATVSTLLPTILAISLSLNLDPRLMMIPATLATSCAFMLPIATPPNAIVFGSGRIRTSEMARYGVLLNLIGIPLLTIGTFVLIKPILQIGDTAPVIQSTDDADELITDRPAAARPLQK